LTPEIITTIKTITKQYNIFTKQLVTKAMGSTSRGKYIFVTMFPWEITDTAPPVNELEKKIHGINATNKNK
jgi:hypothetical protein